MTRRALFLLGFLMLVAACGLKGPAALPTASAQGSTDEYLVLQGGNLRFVGTIDDNLRIHMRLDVEGRQVTGSYYYDDVKTEIPLRGWLDGPQIRLTEYDEKGKDRAEFRGALVAPGRVDGIWRRTASWREPLYPVCLVADGSLAPIGRREASVESRGIWEGTWKRKVYSRAVDTTMEIAFLNDRSFWVYLLGYSGGHSGWIRGMAFITPEGAIYKDGEGAELRFSVKDGLLTVTANEEAKRLGGTGIVFAGVYTRGERKMLRLKDSGVLKSESQEEKFRAMTGPYYESFLAALQLVSKKEDLDGYGATVYSGFARGLALYLRGMVMRTADGRMWAAVLTQDKQNNDAGNSVIIYFTNEPGYRRIMPNTVQKWIDNIQAGQEKKLKVIFYK